MHGGDNACTKSKLNKIKKFIDRIITKFEEERRRLQLLFQDDPCS